MNDDLLKHPYDNGLKRLAREFTDLLKPIVDTVDPAWLRKRFLGKHKILVDRFYKQLGGEFGSGEAAKKIVERLQKNRDCQSASKSDPRSACKIDPPCEGRGR